MGGCKDPRVSPGMEEFSGGFVGRLIRRVIGSKTTRRTNCQTVFKESLRCDSPTFVLACSSSLERASYGKNVSLAFNPEPDTEEREDVRVRGPERGCWVKNSGKSAALLSAQKQGNGWTQNPDTN